MTASRFSEAQVRAALDFIQALPNDFPDFVYDHPGFPATQEVRDRVDAKNMADMRGALEAALTEAHVITEEP